MLRKILRFIAMYFAVFIGLIFIFVVGALYAFIRPEGALINVIFLIILVGWIVYQIKYFWDLIDRRKEEPVENREVQIEEVVNQPEKKE